MSDKPETAVDKFDRLAGRLYYRVFGVILAIPAIGGLVMCGLALASGQVAGGVLCLLTGVGFGLFARWCFRPGRRFSEIDWQS